MGPCVLADSLERAATRREYRGALMDGRLVLTCPYDPATGFLVGHAMQRNKLIYALADAALVVNAEFESGGTWAGAVEHLDRHRFVSVYVRSTGEMGRGLEALLERGARRWENPDNPEAIESLLTTHPREPPTPESVTQLREFQISKGTEDDAQPVEAATATVLIDAPREAGLRVAAILLAGVSELLLRYLEEPKTESEVVSTFEVQKYQGRRWLKRLVADGAIEKLSGPTRYRAIGTPNSGLPLGCVANLSPAEQLFASVRELLLPHLDEPKTAEDVARAFDVQKNQAQGWLTRLMAEGAVMRLPGALYRTAEAHSNLLLPLADLKDTLRQGSGIA